VAGSTRLRVVRGAQDGADITTTVESGASEP
jgi:hypothetical protein